jgi:poly(A) polymerase
VLLAWARDRAAGRDEASDWDALFAAVAAWKPVSFPLRGADALALGLPPGAAIGRLLGAVEAWWEQGDYRADRADCLAELKRRAFRD